jgi:DNA excision repair protein ERCC-3
MRWFAEIPEDLESRFPQVEVKLQVRDGILVSEPDQTEAAWEKYKTFLLKREGPGAIRIKKGSEWELIAKILEDGGLPFAPLAVDPSDFRDRSLGGFSLHNDWKTRDYQEEADQYFKEYGAIGIYWPFGTGKSEYALDLCDRIKGPKLIISSTLSLKEQWIARMNQMPDARRRECHCVVYQSKNEIDRLIKEHKQFTLTVFDEVHHLPAKTFMYLSTIPTKYRLGLTGSPYREDGHINYILALTGYPMGLAWSKFVTEGIISLAQVQVHVVKRDRDKLYILDQLLKRDLGKTMIFCDSLDLGKDIADKYDIAWVHGETKNRLDVIGKNERIVISRVGDEGISIPTLDTIIEIDFLGGSRMQALQRVGRLSHRAIQPDQEPAVHHVLMTEEEVEKYGKRILAYYDKGFKVDWLYGF